MTTERGDHDDMLSKLFDKWHQSRAKVEEQRQIKEVLGRPLVTVGRLAVAQYWESNQELIKDFSKELIDSEATSMIKQVIEVGTSANPLMANREKLMGTICEYARYQVLVIEPPPQEDDTGLRG